MFKRVKGNSPNPCIHNFSFLLARHREPQSISAKLLLPIIPIDIVAYAFTLLLDNLCRNRCIIQQVAGSRRRKQHGRVVKAPDMKFSGRGFKSHSDFKLELFLSKPYFNFSVMFVKSQLVCLPPDKSLKSVPSLFSLFYRFFFFSS